MITTILRQPAPLQWPTLYDQQPTIRHRGQPWLLEEHNVDPIFLWDAPTQVTTPPLIQDDMTQHNSPQSQHSNLTPYPHCSDQGM